MNQAVTAALEREAGNQAKRGKKRKYNAFTPEDRAAIGRYAAENGNAAAVKEFNGVGGHVACPLGNSQSLESLV